MLLQCKCLTISSATSQYNIKPALLFCRTVDSAFADLLRCPTSFLRPQRLQHRTAVQFCLLTPDRLQQSADTSILFARLSRIRLHCINYYSTVQNLWPHTRRYRIVFSTSACPSYSRCALASKTFWKRQQTSPRLAFLTVDELLSASPRLRLCNDSDTFCGSTRSHTFPHHPSRL